LGLVRGCLGVRVDVSTCLCFLSNGVMRLLIYLGEFFFILWSVIGVVGIAILASFSPLSSIAFQL
jgi:hypothetical protein